MTRMIQLVMETNEPFSLEELLYRLKKDFLEDKGFVITSASVFDKKGKKLPNDEE